MPSQLPAHNSSQGLSLLEVVISVAVLAITIGTLVVASNTVISGSDDARNRTLADQYARQALDDVRFVRDNEGWNQMIAYMGFSGPADSSTYYFSIKTKQSHASGDCIIEKDTPAPSPGLPHAAPTLAELQGTGYYWPDGFVHTNSCAATDYTGTNNGFYWFGQATLQAPSGGLNTEANIVMTVAYDCKGAQFSSCRTLTEQTILSNWQ